MKTFIYTFLLMSFSSLLFVSCGDDDQAASTITTADFTASVDENSANGTVLGTIAATTSDGTTLTYAIASQTPTDAVAINSTTGELTINDTNAFDYETNPTITGTVEITAGSKMETVKFTINLNNLDDILSVLSDNKTAYKNANNGDWVEITKAEYNNLFSNLTETTRVGLKENAFPTDISTVNRGGDNYTNVLTNLTYVNKIPKDAYVIAFKYIPKKSGNITRTPKVKINASSDFKTGYSNLGNPLPEHTGEKIAYFVLKGNSTKNANEGYLAAYRGKSNFGFVKEPYNSYYEPGDVNSITQGPADRSDNVYQGIATTQQQW